MTTFGHVSLTQKCWSCPESFVQLSTLWLVEHGLYCYTWNSTSLAAACLQTSLIKPTMDKPLLGHCAQHRHFLCMGAIAPRLLQQSLYLLAWGVQSMHSRTNKLRRRSTEKRVFTQPNTFLDLPHQHFAFCKEQQHLARACTIQVNAFALAAQNTYRKRAFILMLHCVNIHFGIPAANVCSLV